MQNINLSLLPNPRNIYVGKGKLSLSYSAQIICLPEWLNEAQLAQDIFKKYHFNWPIVATGNSKNGLTLKQDDRLERAKSYRLIIDQDGIQILAKDAQGIYYGICTLKQILAQNPMALPYLEIEDWPDLEARGVLLDVSRDKVPTMETLYALIDQLASWKVNQFQLYIEHTYAYQDHQEVWKHASPFTSQEIMELDAYCKRYHIDFVPNQNSLGHFERWLKFEPYREMAECPDGFESPWKDGWRSASTLDPTNPQTLNFLNALYDEFLANFSSDTFNVGCDEPWELGQGKSKAAVEKEGGRVYLEHVLKLYESLKKRGKKMQFWGDIMVHYPELVPELPQDITLMEWGYEATHPFDENGKLYADAGIPFYVCPGTSSWNALIGRIPNAMGNINVAMEAALKHGAIGLLNTDWGDHGHFQALSFSEAMWAYGAAASWYYEGNKGLNLETILNQFVYYDANQIMGKLIEELGTIYESTGLKHINGQVLAYIIQRDPLNYERDIKRYSEWRSEEANLSAEVLREIITKIDTILAPIHAERMQRDDAEKICLEVIQAARLIQHGAKWLLYHQEESDYQKQELLNEIRDLIIHQREVWLLRNRRGGLEDSIKRLNKFVEEYQES